MERRNEIDFLKEENAGTPQHLGRNIGRIRELLGLKQEALAQSMGVSQQSVSFLENSPSPDEERLREAARALNIRPEVIRRFSEKSILQYFEQLAENQAAAAMAPCSFNALDKIVELYERLLEMERERHLHTSKAE